MALIDRRSLLIFGGAIGGVIAAPAIVHAEWLMPIKVERKYYNLSYQFRDLYGTMTDWKLGEDGLYHPHPVQASYPGEWETRFERRRLTEQEAEDWRPALSSPGDYVFSSTIGEHIDIGVSEDLIAVEHRSGKSWMP